ncbi:uncharacterized protein LOC122723688 [Manihot esculenta]|uniref:uncharacterized protein LOC122723688 n=1 Tax=Manihot esculenta TaxID=3983 RepID=UPI001CC51B8C|nr:uncharacterized protein LOC122723688 [Manihot esculenta]
MRGRGRVKQPRGPVRLPSSTSQEEANADDGQDHEPQLPQASTGLGDMELQIWVPLASSIQPCYRDRSGPPVLPCTDALPPRPLPPPHRHTHCPHRPTPAQQPTVSHSHSPQPASTSATASDRGSGSASASTPSSAPASAGSTTAVGGTQSFRQTISLINNK